MEEKFDVLNECGAFTGEIATREECHKKGYWHRAVYAFIINDNGEILLQKRSNKKKLWPNKWDVPVGGHVDSGEFGFQALIREAKEELGIDVCENEVKYLLGSRSTNISGDIINNHFNECYIITKSVDIKDVYINKEEVSDVEYFSKEEVLTRIANNYEDLTEKIEPWNFLKKIIDMDIK